MKHRSLMRLAVVLPAVMLALVGLLRVADIGAGESPAAALRTATLEPARDNTLYQSEAGNISNGAGQHLFAGVTQRGEIRRAVLAFDLSAIPPGATVISATLTMNMSKSIAGELPVSLHALQQDWGEGDSDAVGDEGAGAAAAPGDATWLYTFFNTTNWTAPGGDYTAPPSATTLVGGTGTYSWSSPGLLEDVRRWVADTSGNFGWIVIAAEATDPTAKRFDSRENEPGNRPVLTVSYEADAFVIFAPVTIR
jgi:hypothetical protein